MKRMRKMVLGLVIASMLALPPATLHAQPAPCSWCTGWWFENCQTIWWYTQCWQVWVEDPTLQGGFEAVYAFCQFIGLCP